MAKAKKKKAPKAKSKKKPEVAIVSCPACGLDRETSSPEPTYECARCGNEGFDCCVPGTNSLCGDCEQEEDEELNEEYLLDEDDDIFDYDGSDVDDE